MRARRFFSSKGFKVLLSSCASFLMATVRGAQVRAATAVA